MQSYHIDCMATFCYPYTQTWFVWLCGALTDFDEVFCASQPTTKSHIALWHSVTASCSVRYLLINLTRIKSDGLDMVRDVHVETEGFH